MNTSKIEYNGSKVRLWKLNPGAYLGRVRDYNIKTSKRTNKSYINLELDLLVDGQKVDVVKSYCLSMGSNYFIISLMKAVDGIKGEEAEFDELKKHYFRLDVSYDPDGQLRVDKLSVAKEDDIEEYFKGENKCPMIEE